MTWHASASTRSPARSVGLRRAEIARLRFADISETEIYVIGKGGHHRRVPLHPHLRTEVRAAASRRARHLETHAPPAEDWLLPNPAGDAHLTEHHLGALVSRLLPPGWTLHTLRHRFATAAYAATRDLRAVQDLLGHARPETTARYAAVPDGALLAAVHGIPVVGL